MLILEQLAPGISLVGIEPTPVVTTVVVVMAVHTSEVQPLLHQITVICESLLPRQLLRFVTRAISETATSLGFKDKTWM